MAWAPSLASIYRLRLPFKKCVRCNGERQMGFMTNPCSRYTYICIPPCGRPVGSACPGSTHQTMRTSRSLQRVGSSVHHYHRCIFRPLCRPAFGSFFAPAVGLRGGPPPPALFCRVPVLASTGWASVLSGPRTLLVRLPLTLFPNRLALPCLSMLNARVVVWAYIWMAPYTQLSSRNMNIYLV